MAVHLDLSPYNRLNPGLARSDGKLDSSVQIAFVCQGIEETLEDSFCAELVPEERHGMAFGTLATVTESAISSPAPSLVSCGRLLGCRLRSLTAASCFSSAACWCCG
jgi:hypothetical protein